MEKEKNTGVAFEQAIEQIFKFMYKTYPNVSIERNVWITGVDGRRQFDVVIKINVPHGQFLIVVEGKDHNSKLAIGIVDALHDKMKDVNANQGILISKLGFSSQAIAKAKRLGIVLFSLHDFKDSADFQINTPVLIEEIHPVNLNIQFSISKDERSRLPDEIFFVKYFEVNHQNVFDLIKNAWKDGTLKVDLKAGKHEVEIPNLKQPFYLKYHADDKTNPTKLVKLDFINLCIEIKINYYTCPLQEFLHSKMLEHINTEKVQVFFDRESILNGLQQMKPVSFNQAKQYTGIPIIIKIMEELKLKLNPMREIEFKHKQRT